MLLFNANGSFDEIYANKTHLQGAFPSDALFTPNGDMLTANLGPSYPPALAGSISEFAVGGGFLTTLVSTASFPDTGPGDSGFSPSQLVFNLGNQAPSASAGTSYAISEDSPLTLHAVASDPNGDALTYSWDINGDGTFGDAVGANPTVTWAQLPRPWASIIRAPSTSA